MGRKSLRQLSALPYLLLLMCPLMQLLAAALLVLLMAA
jgi:hypothetical protein